ncbi:VF530 family DNA-binding protein [Comamonas guangdongensis]|uniref:VF530 family DNA-binding protein n=1 Tax=Comamonas guangdongensis TaxID=510515 RepID=A0ABV3ZYR6_9BURK
MNTSAQPRNPLHGITLERIVTELVDYYGWDGLSECIPLRCFSVNPSVGSSLKFLRKTPWAREKTESLYLYTLRKQQRRDQRGR